jgi:hypothetical protein
VNRIVGAGIVLLAALAAVGLASVASRARFAAGARMTP